MASEGVGLVADTRFGSQQTTAATAGPKVFTVPIILNMWQDGKAESLKKHLPNMGFAFAGNTFSGQSTHGVASAYLQNLLVETFDEGPTVEAVANLYARCAKLVVNERRQWLRSDIHCFEAVIFGRSQPSAPSQAFVFDVSIDADAHAYCEVKEVPFDNVQAITLGDDCARVSARINKALEGPAPMKPWDVLQAVIEDDEVVTVGGYQQIAVSTPSGVELRPIFNGYGSNRGSMSILGFDLSDLGPIGSYVPAGTHAAIEYPLCPVSRSNE
jgi:hypothetical protein